MKEIFNMNKNIIPRIKKGGAYIYLLCVFAAIIYNFAYAIRIVAKPLGMIVLISQSIGYEIVYVIINHLFIKKVVSNKILIAIEVLLFIALCTVWWADIMYVNR